MLNSLRLKIVYSKGKGTKKVKRKTKKVKSFSIFFSFNFYLSFFYYLISRLFQNIYLFLPSGMHYAK